MTTEECARLYIEQARDLPDDKRAEVFDGLSSDVQNKIRCLEKQAFFVPKNAQTDYRREHLSPSGRYKLVVTPYATSPGSWSYSQGLVYRLMDDAVVAEVQRNYCSFPFAWVENHAKGDFMLAGEDYQGQTVINLKTGGRRDHLPKAASDGAGFCWVTIHPSPTGKLVAVEGCYWACPFEIRFYDFSDPMLPPWVLISHGGQLSDFLGWTDDDHARIGGYENVYKPLGKSESDLHRAQKKGEITAEDFAKYLDDEANWEDQEVNVLEWTRPTTLESLTTFAQECFIWRREQKIKVAPEILVNTRALLERLTAAERQAFDETDEKALVDWALANETNA